MQLNEYQLVRDLADPEQCSFDHHGGCQAHGYLSLQPGEKCPQQEAKDWLSRNKPAAEVLREVADQIETGLIFKPLPEWLRERADRLGD
jgi:hypothetical protein